MQEPYLRFKRYKGPATPEVLWAPMESAPPDRAVVVFYMEKFEPPQGLTRLPSFSALVSKSPEAGYFFADEYRDPICWTEYRLDWGDELPQPTPVSIMEFLGVMR